MNPSTAWRNRLIGERICCRREELALSKNALARKVPCAVPQIIAWERGDYAPGKSYQASLARALDWSVADLMFGGPSGVANQLMELFSAVLGMPVPRLCDDSLRARLRRAVSARIVRGCADVLLQAEALTSPNDFRAFREALDSIIAVAEIGYSRGIEGADLLLFDALDRRVYEATSVLPGGSLEWFAAPDLQKMGLFAAGRSSRHPFVRRYLARCGDVLKVLGYNLPEANNRAYRILRGLLESERGLKRHLAPYHLNRSLLIVAARQGVAASEFDDLSEHIKRNIESGYFTKGKRAHMFDGAAEANALFYQKTGGVKYRTAALKNLERTKDNLFDANSTEGFHVEFSLRAEKLPIILGQVDILECYSSEESIARRKMHDDILTVLKRATEVGSDRVAQQMSYMLDRVPVFRKPAVL